MKRKSLVALITIITLIIAIAAVAQPRPPRGARPDANRLEGPPPGEMGGPGPGRGAVLPPRALAKFLNLSDAQQDQAKAIHESHRDTIEPLIEQARANREAVRAAIEAGNTTAAAEAMVAGEKIRAQIKAEHEKLKAAFTAILNADQKAKFAVLVEIESLRRDGRPERPE